MSEESAVQQVLIMYGLSLFPECRSPFSRLFLRACERLHSEGASVFIAFGRKRQTGECHDLGFLPRFGSRMMSKRTQKNKENAVMAPKGGAMPSMTNVRMKRIAFPAQE